MQVLSKPSEQIAPRLHRSSLILCAGKPFEEFDDNEQVDEETN
jgi:hypothetical protein